MGGDNSLNDDGNRRWRRHGVTGAGLIVAILAALLYQYLGQNGTPNSAGVATAVRSGGNSAGGGTAASQATANADPSALTVRPGSNDQAHVATQNFDFYLLALSLAPAFCADGHQARAECRALDAQSFAATPLTLHGLWPENQRANTYPADCVGATPLELSTATRSAMLRWMPGAADGLARHEWNTHGACTGLAADDYFTAAMRFTEQADAALGRAIHDAAGTVTDAASLRGAANTAQAGFGDSVIFVCRNLRGGNEGPQRRPHLTEVRVCVDNDGPGGAPKTLLRCPDVQRRDQGCGGGFVIDAPVS